jgi:inorganic pyrophosphatase|tara:strand:- start:158 stop:502 length:345 start_codon:yes stop_codon:yes gene_type:complete
MKDLFGKLQTIVDSSEIIIDRPKGSKHPRYDAYVYPMDYGYLEGTKSQDGSGIDVWVGSGDRRVISGILVIADALKKDSEIKILLGCSDEEAQTALDKSNRGEMTAILMKGEGV